MRRGVGAERTVQPGTYYTMFNMQHPRVGGYAPAQVALRRAIGLAIDVRREIDVLRLVAQGMANKQIGRALGITERTVKAHLGRVFRELGVLDRTSAALWARDHLV